MRYLRNKAMLFIIIQLKQLVFYAPVSGSASTTSMLQGSGYYYSCRYCGDTYDYNYTGTTTEDIWIMDLGVNEYDMNDNEFTWIIYKDVDLRSNQWLGC